MDARERAPPPQLRPFSGGLRQAAEAERQATRYGPGRTAERTRADDGPYESMTRGLNHAWCNSQCPGCDGGSGNRGGGGGGGGGGVHCDYGHTPSEHRNTSKYTNTKRVQILYTISFRSISGLISFLSFLSLSLPTRILKSEKNDVVLMLPGCVRYKLLHERIYFVRSSRHNTTPPQHNTHGLHTQQPRTAILTALAMTAVGTCTRAHVTPFTNLDDPPLDASLSQRT